jgi:hypothetical protein
VRGDDQAAFDPWFARTIGADEFGHRFDGRFHRHHVDPDTREMAAAQRGSQRINIDDRSARSVHHHRALRQQREFRRADQPARLRRQRRVHRQRVGGAQQRLQRRRAADAQPEFHAVRQMRIEEHHAEAERLGAQRDRGADAAEPDNAKGLRAEPLDQRVLERAPRLRRAVPLVFVVQEDATPQAQGQRYRVVGDLGGAVIRHVADQHVARRRGRPVELVVTHPHPHDAAQLRKAREIGAGHRETHDHQPIGLGAVCIADLGERRDGIALDELNIGAEYALFHCIGLLAGFGKQNGDGHGVSPFGA